MNNEVGAAPVATRTSGLAIASFVLGLLSCLCLPAPVAMVLGVVALVQMGKDPSLKGKGFAIAGIVLPLAMVPVILLAVAVPNFVKFQARSKQSEAKANLKSVAVAQQSYFAGEERYSESAKEIGFQPEMGGRYAYLLSANPVSGETALYGSHKDALSETDVRAALRKPLAGNAVMGLDPETNAFTAVAVGNIDGDSEIDIWSVSSVDREGPDGTISAWQPFNDFSDVTDSAGSVGGGTSSSRSRFDD